MMYEYCTTLRKGYLKIDCKSRSCVNGRNGKEKRNFKNLIPLKSHFLLFQSQETLRVSDCEFSNGYDFYLLVVFMFVTAASA
jgi:hypothetical protein